jgi:hypothetical protein
MTRTPALAMMAAALIAAAPAAADPRLIPCAVGPHAKIGHMTAERVTARLDMRDERDIRYEYRVLLRNPNLLPAEIVPVLALPGVAPAPALPVTIPARGTAEVLLGWVPVSNPIRRGAPPLAEEVQRSFMLEHCVVHAAAAAPRA